LSIIVTSYFGDNIGRLKTINASWMIATLFLFIIPFINNYTTLIISIALAAGFMNSALNIHFVVLYIKSLYMNNAIKSLDKHPL